MKGDYHRYLAEFAAGDTRKASSEAAHESYKEASTIAASELAPTRAYSLAPAPTADRSLLSCPQTRSGSDSPSTSVSSTTRS